MQLHELQQLCLSRFTDTPESTTRADLEDRIVSGPRSKSTCIAVYRNNVAEIVKGTLSNVFPTVQQLVGDACFSSLARRYSSIHASLSGDLQSYGEAFAAMLDEIYVSTEYAFLGDVARLEFALDECLCAEFQPGITGEQLHAVLSDATVEVLLHRNPSLHLIESRYPILDIWRSHREARFERMSLDQPSQNVVVVRSGSDAQMTVVSRTGARLIRSLSEQTAIDDLLSALDHAEADEIAAALRDIVASNAVTEVVY